MSGAHKHDGAKVRVDLLPDDAVWAVAQVLTLGAAKYAPDNWAKGMAWRRLVGAAQRHLKAFASGEDADDETGLLHTAHAACCCLFLVAYQLRNLGTDDRVKCGLPEMPEKTLELIARFENAKAETSGTIQAASSVSAGAGPEVTGARRSSLRRRPGRSNGAFAEPRKGCGVDQDGAEAGR